MARFTLTREFKSYNGRGDGESQQYRLTDSTTGKFWLADRTLPSTGVSPGGSVSGLNDIAGLIGTMLLAVAPTA